MLPKALRDLPYLVHTNRELGLMLRGQKPMACFMYFPETMPECIIRYLRMFDRYVEQGRLIKRLHVRLIAQGAPYPECHEIFYTLPGEEWRVQAKLDLFSSAEKWSASDERRFGELLGYADWQIDFWLRGFRRAD